MPVAFRGLPVLLLVALAACDAEPGLPADSARPVLESVRVTPVRDSLATAAATAAVPLAVEGVLGGAERAVVRVLVRYQETDSLVAEVEADVAAGPFRVEAPLTLPRGATGAYEVDVTTEGPGGRLGDRASAVLQFAASSLGPPTVRVDAPGAAEINARGVATLVVSAVVSDPDGLANVVAVGLRQAGTEGIGFRLFDRGRTVNRESADAVAGDGRYTEEVAIGGAEPGELELEIIAVDRAGLVSEPAPFAVTLQ